MDRDKRDEVFSHTVGSIWREGRVSCPHRDILRAYLEGSLEEGPAGYVKFHLEKGRCPWCTMVVQELQTSLGLQPLSESDMEEVTEKTLRSTILQLRSR